MLYIKAYVDAYKEDSDEIINFWKIIRDNCGFHGLNQLKFLNLVTMATNKIV